MSPDFVPASVCAEHRRKIEEDVCECRDSSRHENKLLRDEIKGLRSDLRWGVGIAVTIMIAYTTAMLYITGVIGA